MIIGIGVDIVEIKRFSGVMERQKERFLLRLFTPDEQQYCKGYRDPVPHFAARFAAKEAVYKALFPRVGRYFGFDAVELEPGSGASLTGRVVSPIVVPHAPAAPLQVQVRWLDDAVGTLLIVPPLT